MDPLYQPSGFGLQTSNSVQRDKKLLILTFVLGFGVLALTIATIVGFIIAGSATTNADKKALTAATAARADQKKADELAARLVQESPYRTYAAPTQYGSFKLAYPKSWSSYASYSQGGARTPLELMLNPDLVSATDGKNQPLACHLQLIQSSLDDYLTPYKGATGINTEDITVSGIKGKNLSGDLGAVSPDNADVVRLVVIPIRDKVMVFTNEDANYASEFTNILEQANIVP